MKKLKRISLVLVCTLVVGILGGCGNNISTANTPVSLSAVEVNAEMNFLTFLINIFKSHNSDFDAKNYMQVLLDASYKNDPTGFVAMNIGTAEEAAALYEEGIDTEMEAFLAGLEVSTDLQSDFRQLFKDMLANTRYSVYGAEKLDDVTWEVTVIYEQMIIFSPVMDAYELVISDMIEEWFYAPEIPSEEEMTQALIVALRDCLQNALANTAYAEPALTTIKVELIDGKWVPNRSDVADFELILFDTDSV